MYFSASTDLKKVNLFIVGAPKCGTTAWFEYLGSHSKIQTCASKEPHYFSTDFPNFRWAKSEADYHSLFDFSDKKTQFYLEASPMYLYSKEAAKNIYRYNPSAKILIFIRRHDDFLVSYHQQLLNIFEENVSLFEEAWKSQLVRSTGRKIPSSTREALFLRYSEVAKFSDQIEQYTRLFLASNIKIVLFDEWADLPQRTYLEILEFLNLKDEGVATFRKVNSSQTPRSKLLGKILRRPPKFALKIAGLIRRLIGVERLRVSSRLQDLVWKEGKPKDIAIDLREEIINQFSDDRRRLEELLGVCLDAWRVIKTNGSSEK